MTTLHCRETLCGMHCTKCLFVFVVSHLTSICVCVCVLATCETKACSLLLPADIGVTPTVRAAQPGVGPLPLARLVF